MVDVVTEIIIHKPIEQVAEYASDPGNAPEWYVNIKSAEWKTAKLLSVGSQVTFVADFMGRKLEYIYEIIEFIKGQKMIMRTAQGPFPMETTYTWTAIDHHSTKMILRNKGNPAGFFKLLTPFISFMMRKANTKDLVNIKRILENRLQG